MLSIFFWSDVYALIAKLAFNAHEQNAHLSFDSEMKAAYDTCCILCIELFIKAEGFFKLFLVLACVKLVFETPCDS